MPYIITGTEGDDNLVGSDDTYFYKGADEIYGLGGHDIIRGGIGDDALFGGAGTDVLRGEDGDDRLYGSTGADRLIGGKGNDTLNGESEDDTLTGGLGFDTISGGDGHDVLREVGEDSYILTDSKLTSVTGSQHQRVRIEPNLPIYDGQTTISDIRISGMTGAVSDVNVMVNISHKKSSDLQLSLYAPYLPLDTTAAPIVLSSLQGSSASNYVNTVFDESATEWIVFAAPPYTGTYRPLNSLDVVNGTDPNGVWHLEVYDDVLIGTGTLVEWYLDVTSEAFVDEITGIEEAELTGNMNDNVTNAKEFRGDVLLRGLAGNDKLFSGWGNDTLSGGSGVDTMVGGAGDDVYIVSHSQEVTFERPNEGVDTIQSLATRTLRANEENLTLIGVGNKNGYGNSLNNFIRGNAQDNLFNGKGGNDTMVGGSGEDTYVVDSAGDQVREYGDYGFDYVRASVDYRLTSKVEGLTLTGTGNISGIGNGQSNVINGNRGNNLIGGTTAGGASGHQIDTLVGGAGGDVFLLGDSSKVFYDDTRAGTSGTDSFAYIFDFRPGVDRLLLHGDAAAYAIGASPLPALGATGLYLDENHNGTADGGEEVIAVFRGNSISKAALLNGARFV